MSVLWLLYTVLVAGLLGLAAGGAEAALRRTGRQGRWPWALALLGSWVLPLRAFLSNEPAAAGSSLLHREAMVVDGGAAAGGAGPGRWDILLESLSGTIGALPGWLHDPLGWIPAVWVAASVLGGLVLVAALVRLGRKSRRWQVRRVLGESVRVSPDFGPALLGVVAPRIVLPRWTLDLGEGALQMILTHEREHRRARDTLLLSAGAVAVLGAPWNPALWWQFRRLGLAVELDCDRRVLRTGTPWRDYGGLLLDIGARTARIGLPVVALCENRSFLERRLESMTMREDGHRRVRTLGVLALAGALVVVACETPAPTSPAGVTPPAAEAADTEGRDVEGARIRLREVPHSPRRGQDPLLIVDGVVVNGRDITVDPESVDRIEVVKGEAARALYGERAAGGLIRIITKDQDASAAAGEVRSRELREVVPWVHDVEPRPSPKVGADPLVVVVGVMSELSLEEIQRAGLDIDRVEVVKGEAARALYGERAAEGLVQIWTRGGGS